MLLSASKHVRWPASRTASKASLFARSKSSKPGLPWPRLSKMFAPTLKESNAAVLDKNASKAMSALLRGGFLRQSSAGIFTLLPHGQRVKEKIERVIDEELSQIGASKLSMPIVLPSALWKESGRWTSQGKELFRLKDRKDNDLLLAPTHEEEITAMVAREVTSWRQLPVKLYQVTPKFRDEARPRAGLLRGREFWMKDLYTFDASKEDAIASYDQVRQAYDRIFKRISLPFHVAQADSGSIGGPLSHEYQYASPAGEDHLLACRSCTYTANEELAVARPSQDAEEVDILPFDAPDSSELILALVAKGRKLNPIKSSQILDRAVPIRPRDGARQLSGWKQLSLYIDSSCVGMDQSDLYDEITTSLERIATGGIEGLDPIDASPSSVWSEPPNYQVQDLCNVESGDHCAQCDAPLVKFPAIEVAHTFYLGTKYSSALGATFIPKPQEGESSTPKPEHFEMGCFGIGLSRIIGAVADLCVDAKGIAWPSALAPYKLLVVALKPEYLDDIEPELHHTNLERADVLFDDRFELSFGQRMKDAELIGYTAVLVLGKQWEQTGHWEVIFRRDESKMIFESKGEAVEAVLGAS